MTEHTPGGKIPDFDLRQFAENTAVLAQRIKGLGHAFIAVTTPSKPTILSQELPLCSCADGEARDRAAPRLIAELSRASVPLVEGIALTKQLSLRSSIPTFARYGIH